MLEYMKKGPDPGPSPGLEGPGESSGPAAFAQAALAGERSRPIDLEAGIRQKMEAHFGLDFGKVRLAQSDLPGKMGVDAIAQGDLIRFAPGAYRPGSSEGEKLLGHELGHLVRQSRMGPGLAGVPIDDPVSESGADNLATSAHSGTAGAVRSFTPVPAASAPMEGGRLWNRIKQDTHRWFLGGKIGSWWRRRRNKEAARADVEDEAVKNFKSYAEPWKNEHVEAVTQDMRDEMAAKGAQANTTPGSWHDGVNPLKDRPDLYPSFMFPQKLYDAIAGIPDDKITDREIVFLRGAAGNPGTLTANLVGPITGPMAEHLPNLSKVLNRYIVNDIQGEEYRNAQERVRNPKSMIPGGDNPENHKIWKATAAQLGGSHTNPFDDGRLAVKQEAIENAKSIDEVQAALDKYVFGHKTTGRIGGPGRGNMDLRKIKDMSKNLAHIVEDFPAIRELIRQHKDTHNTPKAQMYVSVTGDMGWNNKSDAMTGGLINSFWDAHAANSSDPFILIPI